MIPGLDGLRAIAYLFVFFFHAHYLDVGWVGVQLFFVLSGFLITGILLDMKEAMPGKDYFIKFYGRRFLRIFPLYYFYLIAAGIITTWLLSISYRTGYLKSFEEQVRYAFFYVYNFAMATVIKDSSFLLEHLWSLSIEEQFYIFWPLVILLTPKRYQKGLFLVLIGLGPVFRIAFHFLHASGEFSIFSHSVSETLYSLPFTHIDAFAIGAYISRYSIPKANEQFWLLLVLVPLIGFITQYLVTGQLGVFTAFGYPLLMPEGLQYIWGYSLLNYFFAVTILAVARQGLFNRFLEWAPLRYMGRISYGLYVFHQPITWFAFDIQELGLEKSMAQPIATILAFFGTLLVASISYRFMEKPLLDLKDRFFSINR